MIACPYHAWRFQLDGELAFANNCENVATQLQLAPRTITDTPANWKIIVDNPMECHHRPPAHPGFSSSVDSSRHTHTFHRHWTLQHGVSRLPSSGYSFDRVAKNQAFNGFRAWPCVMFDAVPGGDSVTVICECPVADFHRMMGDTHRNRSSQACQ